MSTIYGAQDRVPTERLIERLEELSKAVTAGQEVFSREFTMRIPAEMDRDADLVLHEAACRLREYMTLSVDGAALKEIDMDVILMVTLLQIGAPKRSNKYDAFLPLEKLGYIRCITDPDHDPADGDADTIIELTEKGLVYVNALRAVPEPVEVSTWVIPEKV